MNDQKNSNDGKPRVAIIGAGTMGNGIAQVCALAGRQVILVDISDNAWSVASRPSPATWNAR